MLYSFEPVIDYDCEVLILGTMPGEESLRRQQYYGYSRNHFWKIIFALFGYEVNEDYEAKKMFLHAHHIALWDVVQACDRQGSSDSNIKNVVANDFKGLYESYPRLKYIYFNGKKAQQLYERYVLKYCDNKQLTFTVLPSTSPAHAVAFEIKLAQWKVILESLTK
jgi:TDG/mug DNA glycosylase family protein